MNSLLHKIGTCLRHTFGTSTQARLRDRQSLRGEERRQLADRREAMNRSAAQLEEVIRQKHALSKSMTGTALEVITRDLNRLARELRNLGDGLVDNNNRLALVEEEIRKVDLLLEGANDMAIAVNLEQLAIELDLQRDSAAAVRDGYVNVVNTSPVTDFTEAAGLSRPAPAPGATTNTPELDPLIEQLTRETRRPRLQTPES